MEKESEKTAGYLDELKKELSLKRRELVIKQNEYRKTQMFYEKNFK